MLRSRLSGHVLTENNDVHLAESHAFGDWIYFVNVNGRRFDMFMSKRALSNDEYWDVLAGYKEALDSIGAGMIESETQ